MAAKKILWAFSRRVGTRALKRGFSWTLQTRRGGQGEFHQGLFWQACTATASGPPSKVAVGKLDPTLAPAAQPVPPLATKAPAPVAQAPVRKPAPAAPPAPAAKAPEPAPAKAAPAKPAPAQAAAPARNTDEVLKTVNAWARAWASNDVPGYLAFYAPDFDTPKGMSRSTWESQRKARIAKPRKIEVQVDMPKVRFDEKNRAIVSFRQHYKSGGLDVSSNKTLTLVKNGDKWLIQQERVGS